MTSANVWRSDGHFTDYETEYVVVFTGSELTYEHHKNYEDSSITRYGKNV